MDSRRDKQHALLHTILGEAAGELPIDISELYISEYLRAHDFQSALGALIEVGNNHQVSVQFWWNLKKAAEVLNLHELYDSLRQKRLKASIEGAS